MPGSEISSSWTYGSDRSKWPNLCKDRVEDIFEGKSFTITITYLHIHHGNGDIDHGVIHPRFPSRGRRPTRGTAQAKGRERLRGQ